MTNLEIKQMNGINVTDSRLVAEMIGKEHSKLLRDIRNYCEILAEAKIGLGSFFIEDTYMDAQGQSRPCYLLTKQGCEMVANKMTGEKGVLFTANYVQAFNNMEKQIQLANMPSYMIENPIDRAKRWIEEQEEKEQQKKLLELQTPKVNAWDKFINSEGLITLDDIARLLNIGKRKMLQALRDKGILMSEVRTYNGKNYYGDKHNKPYQRYMKYFSIKELPPKNGVCYTKVYVKPCGAEYLNKILG